MTLSLRDIYTYVVLFWFFSGAQNGWLKSRYLRLEPQSVLTMLRYACIFNGQHDLDIDSLISRFLPCRNMSAWEELWYKARYRCIPSFTSQGFLQHWQSESRQWADWKGGKSLQRSHQVYSLTTSIGLTRSQYLYARKITPTYKLESTPIFAPPMAALLWDYNTI